MKTIYDDGREYDRLETAPGEDLDFYAAHSLPKIPVLELACGTIPLAERGVSITGLDNSEAILSAAQAKAAGLGVSPVFITADMRDFALGNAFDLIFLPNNSLGHLHSLADIQSCFSCVRRH